MDSLGMPIGSDCGLERCEEGGEGGGEIETGGGLVGWKVVGVARDGHVETSSRWSQAVKQEVNASAP